MFLVRMSMYVYVSMARCYAVQIVLITAPSFCAVVGRFSLLSVNSIQLT